MNLVSLTVKEMIRRRVGLILSVLAVVVASGAYVAVETISTSAQDTLRKLTLQMRHNILLVPKGSPHDRVLAADFGRETMSEALVERVAAARDVAADHYVAKLQRRIMADGVLAILTGVRRELGAVGKKKKNPLGFEVKGLDEAHLGHEVSEGLKKKVGDTITVEGQTFKVVEVRSEEGTIDDIRIYINLLTMQRMYDLPGLINAIDAIGCDCPGVGDPMGYIKRTLAAAVPEADVIFMRDKFEMRDKSRRMLRTMGLAVSATLLALCGLGIALYMYHNVSDRRYEMAVLVALGHRPGSTAAALLSKVLAVAVVGGLVGFAVGAATAVAAGPSIAAVDRIEVVWGLWWQALVFALVVCVAAAVVAVWGALRVEPANLLRNQ